ncbi:28375_t:CDS:2 [Gigaspora margarita]|uniref:28375_t:CDS:1 n=1 Tax=Gigaspora margarita TaxID=4874 RepID=A0ABN7UAH0_GIGMA|nr:28375_t:CDS:2 [Gigaspora margarita]
MSEQISTNRKKEFFHWISFENFKNVKEIGKGGFLQFSKQNNLKNHGSYEEIHKVGQSEQDFANEKNSNKLCTSENNKWTSFDQAIEAPDIKILSNTLVKPNIKSGKIKCDVVMLTDGNKKKCNSKFSFLTSTTHLELDKSIQMIPLMFSKMALRKQEKQQKLLFCLLAWIIEDYSEWPLLNDDDDSESEANDLFELLAQSTSTQSVNNQKKKTSIVEPIHDQLVKSLSRHPDYQQRKDEQNLSERLLSILEWDELDELVSLLLPFAQSTKLIEGAQYPTLGMMLTTISLLSSHLYCIKLFLSSTKILSICQLIKDSISAHWESPLVEAYIASYLDPQFKNLSFASDGNKKEF